MPDATDAEMEPLTLASELRLDGYAEADITGQVCWDANRRNLGRVGIRPSARYLCT